MAKDSVYFCLGCGEIHPRTRFYMSYNPRNVNGIQPYCKNYIKEYVYINHEDVDVDKLKYILMRCDTPFLITEFEGAVAEKRETVGAYFSRVNMIQNKDLTWKDSITGNSQDEFDGIYGGGKNKAKEERFEVTTEMELFWGGSFDKQEYQFLESKYNEYINTYECDTPVMEELLQQAAFESLEIRRKRQKKEDVSKNLKNIQDLLGTANIKPNQETGANATEQATFGTLIKKWENEMPIPDPLPEWKKKDVIQYVKVWFLGHLSKMVGLNNPYQKDYEDEIEKYKVDSPFEDEGGD